MTQQQTAGQNVQRRVPVQPLHTPPRTPPQLLADMTTYLGVIRGAMAAYGTLKATAKAYDVVTPPHTSPPRLPKFVWTAKLAKETYEIVTDLERLEDKQAAVPILETLANYHFDQLLNMTRKMAFDSALLLQQLEASAAVAAGEMQPDAPQNTALDDDSEADDQREQQQP